MNIVPCVSWVRRGVAKSLPDKVQLSKDELKRIIEETRDAVEAEQEAAEILDDEDDEAEDESTPSPTKPLGKRPHDEDGEPDDIVDKYGLDDYDDDGGLASPLEGLGLLASYATMEDDPYITLKHPDSDDEDFEIKPTDNLLVAGRAQEDACLLEIYVFNEASNDFYIHHDIILPAFPLAVEWLNFDPGEGKPSNLLAVGSMSPTIDIWDLDVVESLEPATSLGTVSTKKKKKKERHGHTDAVLDLSWNANTSHVLASASADFTVGLWDLSEGKMVTSLQQHSEKVQCVSWHPQEAQSLLSGSFDHTVKVYDCRNPNENYKSWELAGEVERVIWNHFSPFYFFASTDSGHIYYLDVRTDKPVYTLAAHSESVAGLCLSSQIEGLLVTASSDKTLKVWDVIDDRPSAVLEKDFKIGELHCLACCPEAPFTFAIGGTGEPKVWDIRNSAAVKSHFLDRTPAGISASTFTSPPTERPDSDQQDDEEKEDTTSAMGALSLKPDSSGTRVKKDKKKKKKLKKKGKSLT